MSGPRSLNAALDGGHSAMLCSSRTVDQIAVIGRESGWHVVQLELTGPTDKTALMDICAHVFELPEWFGRNWDALADCLGDVQHRPGTLVAFSGARFLTEHDRHVLLEVFRTRVRSGPEPFVVVETSSGSGASGEPS